MTKVELRRFHIASHGMREDVGCVIANNSVFEMPQLSGDPLIRGGSVVLWNGTDVYVRSCSLRQDISSHSRRTPVVRTTPIVVFGRGDASGGYGPQVVGGRCCERLGDPPSHRNPKGHAIGHRGCGVGVPGEAPSAQSRPAGGGCCASMWVYSVSLALSLF